MKSLLTTVTLIVLMLLATEPSKAASFSCEGDDQLSPTELAVCTNDRLGALDERLDSWYRRALIRAGYFDQTNEVRAAQREWLSDRDACGDHKRCIRRQYKNRIEQLKNYVEHV